MNNHKSSGPKPVWKLAKKFEAGLLAVHVYVQDGFRRRYSMQFGRMLPDGRLTPNVGLHVEGNFQFTLKDSPAKTLFELAQHAESWALEDAVLRMDARVERDIADANQHGSKTRVTGKTARKKGKTGTV